MNTVRLLLVLITSVTIALSQSPAGNPPHRPPLTNEDILVRKAPAQEGLPVNPSDDPFDVLERARVAMDRDTTHICRQETSTNSGPGSSVRRIIEVAARDRIHLTIERKDRPAPRIEVTIWGNHSYTKTGDGPWTSADDMRMILPPRNVIPPRSHALLASEYAGWQVKPVVRTALDGVPVLAYELTFQRGGLHKTIKSWVGVNDALPRSFVIITEEEVPWGLPIISSDVTSCTYGGSVTIHQPTNISGASN